MITDFVPDLAGLTDFDPAAALSRLADELRTVVEEWGRRFAVVAASGGIDSSVVLALCARTLGPEHVLCLRLPERQRGVASSDLVRELADGLGVRSVEVPIGPALEALGCYAQQARAVSSVVGDYVPGWPFKVVRSAPGSVTVFSVVVKRPDGSLTTARLSSEAYRLLLSASNMKQRVRTLVSYTWADQVHGVVVGTPNLLEYEQGFFVKGGDGLADVKPIARLYKRQVYELGRHLRLPEAVLNRPPTTETFDLDQSQEEFFFGFPMAEMDLIAWAEKHLHPEEGPATDLGTLAALTGVDIDTLATGCAEVSRRREASRYLLAPPVVFGEAPD